MEDARERGIPFRMWGVTQETLEEFESLFPGKFDYIPLRDDFDYIYRSEDLISLAGRKLHGKRNHLAQFNRSYQWTYEDVTRDNFRDCLEVAHAWCLKNGSCGEDGRSEENCAVASSLHNFEALHMKGGLIRIDGKPVAFSIGEEVNPRCFVVHFEKALDGYNGLYPAINREFAARALSGYEYINREEDMGIEGLRKAKLSYYPAILLEKYMAVPKGRNAVIRTAAPGMERELRCLWQTCFGEPARPVNLYLRNVFRPENCLVSLCGDRVASALHLLPCRIQLPDGKTAPAHYVYAVATFPEFRGRGLVLELLHEAERYGASRGERYSAVLPANEGLIALYAKAGYQPFYTVRQQTVSAGSLGEMAAAPNPGRRLASYDALCRARARFLCRTSRQCALERKGLLLCGGERSLVRRKAACFR